MATSEQISTFIKTIAPIIQSEAKSRGYKYPSAIIAQACLESAYGTSSLGYKYHNYFGMKCGSSWTGKSVNLTTKEEYTTGTLTTIKDNFRVYDSMEAGVKGYFDFISKTRYQNLKNATSSKNYIELIKADGYATSSSYITNVYNVVTKYNLLQYDNSTAQTIKPVDVDIIKKILSGAMGNGATRSQNVAAAGYNYSEVQKKVNEIVTMSKLLKEQKAQMGEFWEITLSQI